MAKSTPQELGKMVRDAFDKEALTARQLWALVILSKHVRLRARNNSAFNNLMNSAFPEASFRQVTKMRRDGSTYPGLEISTRAGDVFAPEDESE
jgi:hypothetical protein